MKFLLLIIINVFVVGLFLYSKLLPYKDRLNNEYKKTFNFFNSVFSPILNFFKRFMKPTKVGTGLAVDMTQIILLLIFLFILNSL